MNILLYSVNYGKILMKYVHFSSLSHVQLFVTPWAAAHQVSLSITNIQVRSIHLFNHLKTLFSICLAMHCMSHLLNSNYITGKEKYITYAF